MITIYKKQASTCKTQTVVYNRNIKQNNQIQRKIYNALLVLA
jgi:hypothetical protein